VISWLRTIGFLPKAAITRDQAEQLARAESERHGWKWVDPVHVEEAMTHWRFMTNANYHGGNVNIFIDARAGAVRKAGFARR
jgi:hypothetical protein